MELGGQVLQERPRNALKRFAAEFGLIEAFAMLMSGFFAAAAWFFFTYFELESDAGLAAAVALAGPILEKIFFTVPGIIRGLYLWIRNKDDQWYRYVLREWQAEELLRVYRADLIWHDSAYSFAMLIIAYALPPEWRGGGIFFLLSSVVFVLALIFACWAEVQYSYLAFRHFRARLRKRGAVEEHYGQVRFLVLGKDGESEQYLQRMLLKFNLFHDNGDKRRNRDFAVQGATLPVFNEWRPILQIRAKHDGKARLHLVFFRERTLPPSNRYGDSCLYGETIKLAWDIESPTLEEIRRVLGRTSRYIKSAFIEELFSYDRRYVFNDKTISFAYDTMVNAQGDASSASGIVEFKFWLCRDAIELVPAGILRTSLQLHCLPTTQPRFLSPAMLRALPDF